MSDVKDYESSLSNPASRRYETFSYLPPMTPGHIRLQVEYIVAQGWHPAIEHSEPGHATGSYWYMWKLPLFGETSVERVLAEAELCHRAHPDHHVRLIGYDNRRQTQGAAMVIRRGRSFCQPQRDGKP